MITTQRLDECRNFTLFHENVFPPRLRDVIQNLMEFEQRVKMLNNTCEENVTRNCVAILYGQEYEQQSDDYF